MVEFVECVFSGRLDHAYFNGAVPHDDRASLGRSRNEFYANDFRDMDLYDVAFRTGIDLTQQRLPTGPNYVYVANAPTALASARANLSQLRDLEFRRNAWAFLDSLTLGLEGDQQQLLLRPDAFPDNHRDVVDRVFMALVGGDT